MPFVLTSVYNFQLMAATVNEIDQYISSFPDPVQKRLQQVRKTIKKAAPEAEELISYAMPAYRLHGMLVYFAGFKNHIGFYPVPSGIKAFEKELAAYKASKATAQFPHDKPIPFELIAKIVKFRVEENLKKAETKTASKTTKSSSTDPFSTLPAPAQRALKNREIKTLQQLSHFSEKEILTLHGLGPGSIPKLKAALQKAGLDFTSK